MFLMKYFDRIRFMGTNQQYTNQDLQIYFVNNKKLEREKHKYRDVENEIIFHQLILKTNDKITTPSVRRLMNLFLDNDHKKLEQYLVHNSNEICGHIKVPVDNVLKYHQCYVVYQKLLYQDYVSLTEMMKMFDINNEDEVLQIIERMKNEYPHYSQASMLLLPDRFLTIKIKPYGMICNNTDELITTCLGYPYSTEGIFLPVETSAQSLAMAIISVPNVTVSTLLNILELYKANNVLRGSVRDIMRRTFEFVHLPIPSMIVKIAYLSLINVNQDIAYIADGLSIYEEVVNQVITSPCLRKVKPLIQLPIVQNKCDDLKVLLYLVGNGKFMKLQEILQQTEKSKKVMNTTRMNMLLTLLDTRQESVYSLSFLMEFFNTGDNPWSHLFVSELLSIHSDYIEISKEEDGIGLIPFVMLTKKVLVQLALSEMNKNLEDVIRRRVEFEGNNPLEPFLFNACLYHKTIFGKQPIKLEFNRGGASKNVFQTSKCTPVDEAEFEKTLSILMQPNDQKLPVKDNNYAGASKSNKQAQFLIPNLPGPSMIQQQQLHLQQQLQQLQQLHQLQRSLALNNIGCPEDPH